MCKGMPRIPTVQEYASYTKCARVCQQYLVCKGMPVIPSVQGFAKNT